MTKNEDLKACDTPVQFFINERHDETDSWIEIHERIAHAGGKARRFVCEFISTDRKLAMTTLDALNCPIVTPTNTAMEDNTGRSGSNGMASVEGSTPSLPNPSTTDGDAVYDINKVFSKRNAGEIIAYCEGILSGQHPMPYKLINHKTTDGDAERALKAFDEWMSQFPLSDFGSAICEIELRECADAIRTALQSTRKPPVQCEIEELTKEQLMKRLPFMGNWNKYVVDYIAKVCPHGFKIKVREEVTDTSKTPEPTSNGRIDSIAFTLENTQCGVITQEDIRYLITQYFSAMVVIEKAKHALGNVDCQNSEAAMAFEACKKFISQAKGE